MTTAKTKTAKTAKTTKKASKVATKAPKKKVLTKKKAPAKAVTQEKEITKALVVVPEAEIKTEIPVEVEKVEPEKTEVEIPVEAEKIEPEVEVAKVKKAPKRKINKGEIRHILSPSRGGKVQQRLKGTAEGKNPWGHKLGSQAAKIDHLIDAGRFSLTEIQTMSGARTKGRIYNHFRALKEHGYPVVNEGGKVKFA